MAEIMEQGGMTDTAFLKLMGEPRSVIRCYELACIEAQAFADKSGEPRLVMRHRKTGEWFVATPECEEGMEHSAFAETWRKCVPGDSVPVETGWADRLGEIGLVVLIALLVVALTVLCPMPGPVP
jgi:hypothetical protein